MNRSDSLLRLDTALLEFRRFAEVPTAVRDGPGLRHGGGIVEISTMLVVDAVARCGSAKDFTIGNVAEALHVAHSTASRLVERAVQAGMVHRRRSTQDPRRTVISLTAAGQRLQRQAVDFRTERLDALLADWSAADVATFTRLLERFARGTHAPTQEKKP